MSEPRPVTVVTGFLGAGKTTAINRALNGRALERVGIIVNEFGQVGLDHEFVAATAALTVTVSGGCACCTRRDELAQALREVLNDYDRAGCPLEHVVIETSGLADPAPIAFTLTADPLLRHQFALRSIVAVVDAVAGVQHLERHPEAVKQVEIADEILITKDDVAAPAALVVLTERLRALNPLATIKRAGVDGCASVWSGATARAASAGNVGEHEHTSATAICIRQSGDADWVRFGVWLTMFLGRHGEDVLRIKGVVRAKDIGSVAINTVQHVVHTPEHLEQATSAGTELVLIVRGLEPERVARSYAAFQTSA